MTLAASELCMHCSRNSTILEAQTPLTCEWNDCLLAVLRRARRRRKVLRAAPQLQSSKAEGKTNIPRGKHEDPYLATK